MLAPRLAITRMMTMRHLGQRCITLVRRRMGCRAPSRQRRLHHTQVERRMSLLVRRLLSRKVHRSTQLRDWTSHAPWHHQCHRGRAHPVVPKRHILRVLMMTTAALMVGRHFPNLESYPLEVLCHCHILPCRHSLHDDNTLDHHP